MNKHVKRKWLKALRSGKYVKGKSRLGKIYQSLPPQYCCLGVLVCEMAPEFAVHANLLLEVGGLVTYLPDDLAKMWGLEQRAQEILGGINDRSVGFGPVIAYIEENL